FFSSRRRHTRSDRDWSSDVCSSDLSMGTPHENLVALQLFNAVVAVSALLLGAAITERDGAERRGAADYTRLQLSEGRLRLALERSEERRVGKEGGARGWPYAGKQEE